MSEPAPSSSSPSPSSPASPKYPVSATYKVLDGYDIYRSSNLIVALVVVESQQFGRDMRLYRWMMRKGAWKVDLCRMGVKKWKWNEIAAKAAEFTEKYGLKGQAGPQEEA